MIAGSLLMAMPEKSMGPGRAEMKEAKEKEYERVGTFYQRNPFRP